MRNVLSVLWAAYLGLLTIFGHAVLVLLGIALAAWATIRQFDDVNEPAQNVVIFAVGFLLFTFSAVRRFVWTYVIVVIGWAAVVAATIYVLVPNPLTTPLDLTLAGIVLGPPIVFALALSVLSQPPRTRDRDVGRGLPDDLNEA